MVSGTALRRLGLIVDDQDMKQPVVIRTPLLLRMYVIGFMAFWVGALLSFPIASVSDALLVTVMVVFGVAIAPFLEKRFRRPLVGILLLIT